MAQGKCAKLSRSPFLRPVKSIFSALLHFKATMLSFPKVCILAQQYFRNSICLLLMHCDLFHRKSSSFFAVMLLKNPNLVWFPKVQILLEPSELWYCFETDLKDFHPTQLGPWILWNCNMQGIEGMSGDWTLVHGKISHCADPKS